MGIEMIGQKVKVAHDHPHRAGFIGRVTSQCPGNDRWHVEVMKVDFKRPKTGNLAVGIILNADEFEVLA
jgi:hypothetical protein